jgi:hypothetical protein
VTTILFIILGLIPAAAIRYAIARKPLEVGPAVGVCLGILLAVSIVVTGLVQKQFARPEQQEVAGPIPILADLVYRMATISLPVTVGSFFILRARSRD